MGWVPFSIDSETTHCGTSAAPNATAAQIRRAAWKGPQSTKSAS